MLIRMSDGCVAGGSHAPIEACHCSAASGSAMSQCYPSGFCFICYDEMVTTTCTVHRYAGDLDVRPPDGARLFLCTA